MWKGLHFFLEGSPECWSLSSCVGEGLGGTLGGLALQASNQLLTSGLAPLQPTLFRRKFYSQIKK